VCGIVAVAGVPGPVAIEAALTAIAHRGPDGRGIWRGDGVTLGHVRLAVIDPEGGAQPIANEDGSIVATVNGELYGHDAEARWLASRGHVLRSRGDAEVLVHLYEERGEDFVRTTRGELAFVLWDARRRRLVAGRDRFGVKPLLWTRWRGGIALASEAKALFALGVPARWDAASFWHAAHVQYPLPDRTLFEGIHVLEPGCMLTWDGGEPRIARYWDLPRIDGHADLDSAALQLREALDDAVRVRLRADARVCVQLSGGLDSSSVAALAARAGGIAGCFTVGFPDVDYDERALAAETARALGVPLTVIDVDAAAIAEDWPTAVAHGEGLAINGHLVGKWRLSRAMREAGFKVALTGEGADELLAGYAHLRRDAGVAAEHAASLGVMLPAGDELSTAGVTAQLGFVPTWIAAKASLGSRVRSLLAPDLAREHDPYGVLVAQLALRQRSPLHTSAEAWIRTALAHYILRTLGDGMEMAHGIEGRVPFLDHRVAELAFAWPAELVATGSIDKPVLRQAMAGIVPDAILARPKHPFLAPPLSRLAPALVQDTLRTHARTSPLVDRARLLATLDALPALSPAAQQAWDPALMLVLSAAILEARYRA
jgi:asparagine synthase (glutamine-hydrolysing)